MNRSIGSGHGPAAAERRPDQLASRPRSADRCRWRAAGVAAFTADLRRQSRSGHPARNAEPARPQPVRAGSR
jgi:hypothetical protein